MARVFVTGATGFIGRHLVPALRGAGHHVTAGLRRPDPDTPPLAADATVLAPFDSGSDWSRILSGMEAVVHLAGRAHDIHDIHDIHDVRGEPAEAALRAANVGAVAELVGAAGEAGVQRFIHMSTAKVMGEVSATPFRETDTPRPRGSYAQSKCDGETVLARACRPFPGMVVTVLRPPLVYGPGVAANFASLLRLAGSPWPLPLAGLTNRRSLIYVANLADAVRRVIERAPPLGGTFAVTDGPAMTLAEIMAGLRRAAGRPARLFTCPRPVLGLALDLAGRAMGRPGLRTRLLGQFEVDDSAFRQAFDWQPPVDPATAFAHTLCRRGAAIGAGPD